MQKHDDEDNETPAQVMERLTRENAAEHTALLRKVSGSYEAALEWLERVGSWPSSDAGIREITAAAHRRVNRSR